MTDGLANLRHIVVLMMENRSFDHMLGSLKAQDQRINGLTGHETNLDSNGELVKVQPLAAFHGQLNPSPNNQFSAVHKQLFLGTQGPPCAPAMKGFVQSYFEQTRSVVDSHRIMYYFTPDKLPVLTTLARGYAVFNGWFSSIPGPTVCNHVFAHYGTSFGKIGMDSLVEVKQPYLSIYERMAEAGRSAKLYYFDQSSSTVVAANLLRNHPRIFATYDQFIRDCALGMLSDYSFIVPNYNHHTGPGGALLLASDQHPGHDVQAGEVFIASIYNAIRQSPALWKSTVLLVVYDEHGGIFDHVPPPPCMPDGFTAPAKYTETTAEFTFDRLGVRVPAILISPWIAEGTVIPGTEDDVNGRVFEHASIPSTVTRHFIGDYNHRSPREKAAQSFLDLLSNRIRPDSECPVFNFE